MYNCKICGSIHNSLCGVAKHIIKKHNISSKEYYDNYLKKQNDGVCINCGKQTKYVNITTGYKLHCGVSCGLIDHRKKLKQNKEKFDIFSSKVSKNQKRVWKNRSKIEKFNIFQKISSKVKNENINLTKSELKEKYGWLNKLKGVERRDKIEEILNKSLRYWSKNASLEEKLEIVERIRKTKLGDRYAQNIYENFINYKNNVMLETSRTYRKFKNVINPNNLKRSRNCFQLDHKFSIVQGFIDNVDIEIMSSVPNLEMLSAHDNNSKNKKCSISKDRLIDEYRKFINEYNETDI